MLDSITKTPLDGARSVAAVLHGRAGKEPAPARGNTVTWAERVPGYATPDVREFFTERDRRQAEEGEQLAANPPRWALEAWGVPPKEPGPLRDDWMQRAAVVGSYRELAGITDPAVAIGPPPARQAGMSEAFAASVRALGLPDEAAMLKAMGRGELTAQVREFARAQAAAPADVRLQVDLTDRARERYAGQAKAARQARAELATRGPARPGGHNPQAGAAETREAQAAEPATAPAGAASQAPPEAGREATAEPQPGRQPEPGREAHAQATATASPAPSSAKPSRRTRSTPH